MLWLYGCWVWSSVDDFTQAMAAAKSKSALHVSVGYRSFEACRRFHRRRLWSAWAVHDVFCYWTNWEESQTIEVRQQQVLNRYWTPDFFYEPGAHSPASCYRYWTPDFFYEPGARSPASCYRYWTGTERLISSMNLVPAHPRPATGTEPVLNAWFLLWTWCPLTHILVQELWSQRGCTMLYRGLVCQ